MQSVGDNPAYILEPERLQDDLQHPSAGLTDRRHPQHQRMRGSGLLIPIGADEKQVIEIRLGQQVLEKLERRNVQPLQVVEEQRQRMLRLGEDTE